MRRRGVPRLSSVDDGNSTPRPTKYKSRAQASSATANYHHVIDLFVHFNTSKFALPPPCGLPSHLASFVAISGNQWKGDPVENSPTIANVLADVGPRLKRLRVKRGITLTELASTTGISKSTLSRLETGQRKPSLELLLPIAQAHQVPVDELVGAPAVGDPRIRLTPKKRNGRIVVPLTEQPGGLHAWKVVIPPERGEPKLRIHEGYEWLYVLSGQMRLILGDHDITMGPGEVAEFDTQFPHWFGPADDQSVEILSLHNRQGERAHVRAAPRRKVNNA